ncbi:uncharacterized protein LOC141912015 [Tubulanus polymorphus]|uniref:uncharacterized protein LOC141912015 n=1 Tax=Tubulanus polymorphus TaxID=672921 RepID=UPI003DA3C5EB
MNSSSLLIVFLAVFCASTDALHPGDSIECKTFALRVEKWYGEALETPLEHVDCESLQNASANHLRDEAKELRWLDTHPRPRFSKQNQLLIFNFVKETAEMVRRRFHDLKMALRQI